MSDMWVIAPYFNPLGFSGKKEHFKIFRDHLVWTEVTLLVVELSLGGNNDL